MFWLWVLCCLPSPTLFAQQTYSLDAETEKKILDMKATIQEQIPTLVEIGDRFAEMESLWNEESPAYMANISEKFSQAASQCVAQDQEPRIANVTTYPMFKGYPVQAETFGDNTLEGFDKIMRQSNALDSDLFADVYDIEAYNFYPYIESRSKMGAALMRDASFKPLVKDTVFDFETHRRKVLTLKKSLSEKKKVFAKQWYQIISHETQLRAGITPANAICRSACVAQKFLTYDLYRQEFSDTFSSVILRKGRGDCKSYSVLMTEILERLSPQTHPILAMPKNHAAVWVTYQDKVYLTDPQDNKCHLFCVDGVTEKKCSP